MKRGTLVPILAAGALCLLSQACLSSAATYPKPQSMAMPLSGGGSYSIEYSISQSPLGNVYTLSTTIRKDSVATGSETIAITKTVSDREMNFDVVEGKVVAGTSVYRMSYDYMYSGSPSLARLSKAQDRLKAPLSMTVGGASYSLPSGRGRMSWKQGSYDMGSMNYLVTEELLAALKAGDCSSLQLVDEMPVDAAAAAVLRSFVLDTEAIDYAYMKGRP